MPDIFPTNSSNRSRGATSTPVLADTDEDTERRAISCLLHPKASAADTAMLPPASDISDPTNRAAYAAAVRILETKGRPDYSLLSREMRSQGVEVSDEYWRDIRLLGAHPEFLPEYASILHDLAVRRRVKDAASLMYERASRHTGDSDELLALLDKTVQDTYRESGAAIGGELIPFQTALEDAWKKIVDPGEEKFILTGISNIDDAVGGLYEGELTTIAGPPGGGKTSLVIDFVLYSAVTSRKRWLIVSKEMTPDQLARRAILMKAGVSSLEVRRSQQGKEPLSAAQWARLNAAKDDLRALRSPDGTDAIMIVPPMQVSARSAIAMIRREKIARGLDGFAIDYLQILDKGTGSASGARRLTDTQESQIAEDAQAFKDATREMRLTGIILSQFNRGDRRTANPRPTMDSLKGSGGIAAASDLVMALHNPSPEEDEETIAAGMAVKIDCIVLKGRNLARGDINLDFEPQYTRFFNRGEGGKTRW